MSAAKVEPDVQLAILEAIQALEKSLIAHFDSKFDAIKTDYVARETHDDLRRRVESLEKNTELSDVCRDLDLLKERVWLLAGAAAAVGSIVGIAGPWLLSHL